MLGSWFGSDPDSNLSVEGGEVSDQLPEMIVVGALELVLDHDGPAGLVLSEEVNTERTRRLFAIGRHERDVEMIVDDIEVLFEPACGVPPLCEAGVVVRFYATAEAA